MNGSRTPTILIQYQDQADQARLLNTNRIEGVTLGQQITVRSYRSNSYEQPITVVVMVCEDGKEATLGGWAEAEEGFIERVKNRITIAPEGVWSYGLQGG